MFGLLAYMKPIQASLLAVVLAGFALGTSNAGQKATPCATLALQTAPATVSPGGVETLSGSITNSSESGQRFTITYVIDGPCNYSDIYTLGVSLKRGETRADSVSQTAPLCPGTYTVTATVTAGGTYVTSAPASYTVQ